MTMIEDQLDYKIDEISHYVSCYAAPDLRHLDRLDALLESFELSLDVTIIGQIRQWVNSYTSMSSYNYNRLQRLIDKLESHSVTR